MTRRTRGVATDRPTEYVPSRTASRSRGSRKAKSRGGIALAQRMQVLAQPRLDGAERPTVEALDEPADRAKSLLEGEPRVALAELGRVRQTDVPARHPDRRDASGSGGQPAGRQDRVQQGQPEGSEQGRGSEVAFDPLEDRRQGHELPRRVEIEHVVDKALCAGDLREPCLDRRPGRIAADVRRGAREDRRHRLGRLAHLAATELVAADRAPIVPRDGPRRARDAALHIDFHRPRELIGDERPAACRAARRIQVTDRCLEARLRPWRCCHRLERRIQVADIRRSKHDLREHPGERARLEGHGSALTVDGGSGDPAATARQVDDHVAGARVELDLRRHDRGWRRRRQTIEDRQRLAGLGGSGRPSSDHRQRC